MPVRKPAEILEAAASAGMAKANMTSRSMLGRLFISSCAAGAFIALGGALSFILGQGFPEASQNAPGLSKLISGAVFPIGLMLVVILGADLFTGNNALLVPPLTRGDISAGKTMCNWTLVWIGNFAGALLVAYFLVFLPGLSGHAPYHDAICNIAIAKTSSSFWIIFLKGIGANWCVCLAVWMALSGKRLGEKLLACEIPVFAFVALGYEHCIANMFFIPLGMMEGAPIDIYTLLISNLLPATIGNIIGGAVFVGTVQVYLWGKRM